MSDEDIRRTKLQSIVTTNHRSGVLRERIPNLTVTISRKGKLLDEKALQEQLAEAKEKGIEPYKVGENVFPPNYDPPYSSNGTLGMFGGAIFR